MEEHASKNGYQKKLSVAIVGGGLVGSLAALFFAKRGHDVHLFEYREDIRKTPQVRGRSINLSLSSRAWSALNEVGLQSSMAQHGLPMQGRMIHSLHGDTKSIPYDRRTNQCIYSVGRKYLNEVLLTATEKYSNVNLYFQHKLVSANLEEGRLTFLITTSNKTVERCFDLVVGADGAFSTVRRCMMKQPLFDFSQTYIEHGYLELCIPPTKEGQFAMPYKYLHIWPRGEFMMIALPNQDQSWTVTLFMPFVKFKQLDTPEALLKFFNTNFPDAIPLIGKDKLISDFFKGKPLPLVSIKCQPYHISNKAIIVGDAAHAMVPFYGQGMNAGFEDCLLLDRLLTKHGSKLDLVLKEFSEIRVKDAHAICDLAMYNYVEMRDLVMRRTFIMRKKLDDFLHWLMPSKWVPLYNSVTFTDMGYSKCITNRKWQDKV
ncbi:kynurenine 3-monooxygenase cn [Arctopsyche grandis]|uniref:kynurenine 3-monooxygenase cn n=1 Tax=Arctopsyche grandis TaxID=121162 RepID=UPI00406D9F81